MKFPVLLSCRRFAILLAISVFSGTSMQAVAASSTPSDPASGTPQVQLPASSQTMLIPGPLRSFMRMAGVSQEVKPAELLPLLARKIYLQGYEKSTPTEYLLLIDRYLQQARELQTLAGLSGQIKVSGCADSETLLKVLGYRLRQGCGQKGFSLETANPTRAFLTIDSGFPLVDLEEALETNTPFVYPYSSTRVPILFHEADWATLSTSSRRVSGDVVDVLLSDPQVARLYWAISQDDSETRASLQRYPGLKALLPYASVLDFYGSQLSIRSGHVVIPGGLAAKPAWKELVGTSPDSAAQFVANLLMKDKGWMAAYFDALCRVGQEQQKHLTEPARLKRLYEAFRGGDPDASPTQGVFQRNPNLLVLFTRVQWDADGSPHVPGDLAVWKQIVRQKSSVKAIRDLGRRAQSWNHPEQVFEGMAGLSLVETDTGPLQVFLMAIEIDRQRQPGNHLSPATLRTLASSYAQFNTWYQAFTEFPYLNDASIERFVSIATFIDRIPNRVLRANSEGSFQSTLGLWQILARQGQIPDSAMTASWLKVIEPFSTISSAPQLFDAARSSLSEVLAAAGRPARTSQTELVDLLAGPTQLTPDGQQVHASLANRIGSVLEDQRLVSLDTLFALNDGLKQMEQSGGTGSSLLPLAAELREFDLPQPIFTHSEKISWAPPIYTDHHAELQVKTDLTRLLKASASPAQLESARGQLSPFLRDTLVGLNYAYYEPPDAQMLHHNPLFVRSHDFLGISVQGSDRLWGAPRVQGVGTPAGGGAYLMGSLSDLSYALATTEDDFIAPRNIQALILRELAPILMVSATIPRYWTVTPNELHAAALYQRAGEELVTASAKNADLKEKVVGILSDEVSPQFLEEIEQSLLPGNQPADILPRLAPAETAYLAAEFRHLYSDQPASWGPASQQLEDLRQHDPEDADWERISRDFGVPHPSLAQTNARELLGGKPFPFFGSYSSRLFGESWESTNLYWGRLADEMGYSPVALNSLVPDLTRRMIANTFATDLDDWPAILRAMQKTGEEFRRSKAASASTRQGNLQSTETTKNAALQ